LLKTFVTHSRVVEFEPRIADYLGTGQSDYSTIIEKAKEVMTQGLKQNNLELKKLCIPLTLQASTSETTSATGSKSDEDVSERRIWFVDVSVQSGDDQVFTLQGTNDKSSETWTDITTLSFTAVGDDNVLFDDVYSYYRVNYSGTSATYSSLLYDESFYLAHIYKSLEMIYVTQQKVAGTIWESKASEYLDLYERIMKNIKFTYDADGDNSISDGEQRQVYRPSFTR